MATITVWVATDMIGSKVERMVEVDDDDLEGLTDAERETYLRDYAQDEIHDLFEWGWHE